ncbi:MAG: hypothetical protein AVDCRST_MAG93-8285, partial [uncultured Chloroflexia bacterium]
PPAAEQHHLTRHAGFFSNEVRDPSLLTFFYVRQFGLFLIQRDLRIFSDLEAYRLLTLFIGARSHPDNPNFTIHGPDRTKRYLILRCVLFDFAALFLRTTGIAVLLLFHLITTPAATSGETNEQDEVGKEKRFRVFF